MADQIKKIIFTTKEAYDQKVAAGTLDPEVVYAIDASQAVTPTEVKTAVNDGFDKFGLTLGIDKEKAEFYNIPLALADMVRDVVIEKIDAAYQNETLSMVANGTREVKVGNFFLNTVVTVKQDGVDLGMVRYDLDPSVVEDNNQGTYRVATIHLPEALNLSKDFEVKISNVFGTKSNTITFVVSFDPIAKEKLEELYNGIDFDGIPLVVGSYNPGYGTAGSISNNIRYYQNTDSAKEYFRNNVQSEINYNTTCLAIPDKSLLTSDVLELLKNYAQIGRYILFTNLELTEYYDISKNTWNPMPSGIDEKLTKLRDYTNYYFNSIAINKAKTDEIARTVDLSTINTSSKITLYSKTIDSDQEATLRASDVIDYSSSIDVEEFVDTLISLNTTTPLTAKALVLGSEITQSIINKLAALGSLLVIKARGLDHNYFVIPENFKPLLVSDWDQKIYIQPAKNRAAFIDAPESIKNVIQYL
jgi:hypothetical protein